MEEQYNIRKIIVEFKDVPADEFDEHIKPDVIGHIKKNYNNACVKVIEEECLHD